MSAEEIRDLVRHLFKDGPLSPLRRAAGRRVSCDEIERQALADPAFLGRLARWFAEAGQRLPSFVTYPALVRANGFLLEPGRKDPDFKVALAQGLNLPGSEPQRDLTRAILVCDGTTLESTAAVLNMDLEVLSLFEPLYWNVLHRKLDRTYIARLCGQTGSAQAPGGGQAAAAPGQVWLQVAYELGSPEAVLAAAGVCSLNDLGQIKTLLQQRRSYRLASAATGLAMDNLSDAENPHLRAALRMLAATLKAKGPNGGAAPSISVVEGIRMVLDKLRAVNPGQTPTSPSPESPS